MTSRNVGTDHPLYGKGGKFIVTKMATGETFEVEGIYHWAKERGLNATALIEIADRKPIVKPNGRVTYRRQHKGFVCRRVNTSEQADTSQSQSQTDKP